PPWRALRYRRLGGQSLRSMRGAPVRAGADLDAERDVEPNRRLRRALHDPPDHGRGALHLGFGHFEHQFVMDLHQHARAAEALGGEGRPHPRHRPLDDVGRGTLDRGVDRRPLRALALVLDVRLEPREVRLAAEQGGGEAGFAGVGQRVADIGADAGEALEIAIDHRLRLVRRQLEPLGEAPAGDAVKYSEVAGLRARARVAVDGAEQFLSGAVVDVLARLERRPQRRNVADMGGEAKLDLAVVGGEHDVAGLGDEGVADAPADLRAYGDIHQVRVGRGQPPGLRARQAVAGVDPSRVAVDLLLQRVGVGGFELGQLAPFEHEPGDRHALALQPLELVLVGRIDSRLALAAAGEPHLVEQDVAELLGRADGELAAGLAADPLLQSGDLDVELGREALQHLAVDLDP